MMPDISKAAELSQVYTKPLCQSHCGLDALRAGSEGKTSHGGHWP